MRDLPEDLANEPVRHNWAWWRYALSKFMAGPNSWAVGGLILLVGSALAGVLRLLDGEALAGAGFLLIGVVGIVAFCAHFEREYMIGYLNDRNELIRRRTERRDESA